MIEQIEAKSVQPSFHWAASYGMHCMTQSLKFLEETRAKLEACACTNPHTEAKPAEPRRDADDRPQITDEAGSR